MSQEEARYVPPQVREGILMSGILVREAKVVKSIHSKNRTESGRAEMPSQSVDGAQQQSAVVD